MSGNAYRILILVLLLAGSLGATGIGMGTAAADARDGRPGEWEEQVAADARGDVFLHWPGTVDLYYLTIGELYSITLGEPYMLLRVGYNITEPGEEDVQPPDLPLPPDAPGVPPLASEEMLTTINVTFNVSRERTIRISFFSVDLGETWVTDQGNLISGGDDPRGHREVIYVAPLRRFDLESGDLLSDHNVSAYRNNRLTDTMQGFEPIHDYAPAYYRVHPIVDRALSGDPLPLPVPVPLPPPPDPPVPIPEEVPHPNEILPDDPWAYPPDLGDEGIPYGVPTKEELGEWDPTDPEDRERPLPPVDPERLTEDPSDTSGSRAWNRTHKMTDGTGRLIARADQQIYTASFNHVAWANFTIESQFEETDQRVLMLVAGITGHRWAFRYGLDMPLGMKELPAGGTTRMSFIGAPSSLFSSGFIPATAIFISDWGGLDLAPVTFFNTNTPLPEGRTLPQEGLPRRLVVDLLNADDPFRANEVRKVMVRVRTETGSQLTGLDAVRAYIYPAGTTPTQPYQLHEKAWMDGVYEIDFVFNRPGAWMVEVYFFDYAASQEGTYPNIDFQVRVDHEGKSQPIVPLPAALGSLGLLVLAVAARERMAKAR